MSDFAGLHVHSEHSHLDGFSRVEQIAKRAKALGQSAVALTDHAEVGGHLLFQKACAAEDIKPIFGMEGYHCFDIQAARDQKLAHKANSHITLLAANDRGLKNLWAWSSLAYEEKNFYYRPLADAALMKEYSDGIYASDGCLLTDFGRSVEAGDDGASRQYVGRLLDIFGDRFFMELHTFQIIDATSADDLKLNAQMTALNKAKVQLANEFGVPLVVVNDAHYAPPEDWVNHGLVWQMNTKGRGDQTDSRNQAASWMMGDEELIFWMSKHGVARSVTEEAIRNTKVIAENCNAEITTKLEMPRITGSDRDDLKLFLDHVGRGFKDKVEKAGLSSEVYFPRLEEEIRLITSKGFHGYFNIVADLTKAAKSGEYRKWVVPGSAPDPLLIGPGRGSAGGSLVAYLMDITALDPIKYDLLFSRFLTPGRKGFPDVDVDVPQSKRPDLKEYVAARHGHDHVCGIGTRSRSGPKATLRDLARAFSVSFTDANLMADLIEEVEGLPDELDLDGEQMSWGEILEKKGGDLAPWVARYPELFEHMKDMVGLVRQSGVHAAGILIANKPILGELPTRFKKGARATQFDMYEVEELGALKLDALGIRHLDTLMVARNLIQERHGVWLDYEKFDEEYTDPDIWPQIDRGETLGVFQLETPSGTRSAKEFKPRSERHIADLASVNRPGVIDAGLLPVYMKRRAGKEEAQFDHPLMESIVGDTYGILVYQEQMLKAAQELGGFTPDEADDMRKFIGKKQMDRLVAMQGKFIDGCAANDIDAASATKIWTSIAAAGRYSFNKSHAMGYAMIATWEIWTKHYYPEEFLVALMQTDSTRINLYVREARKRGITILPPDVNLSKDKFTINGKEIRYGLDTVRGVGPAAVKDIMKHQPFTDLDDFLARTAGRGANKKTVLYNLIRIGAFDSFMDGPVPDRRSMLLYDYYSHVVLGKASENKVAKMDEAQKEEHVSAWFQRHSTDEGFAQEWDIPDFDDLNVISEIEKELVGNFITADPMAKYLNMIENLCVLSPEDYKAVGRGKKFYVGGQLTKVKPHKTKKGDAMAFMTVTWGEEDFEVMAFPEAWSAYRSVLEEGSPVTCTVVKLDRNSCHLKTVQRLDKLESPDAGK